MYWTRHSQPFVVKSNLETVSLLGGPIKFNCRLTQKMSAGQLTSVVHTFGSQQFRSKRVTSTSTKKFDSREQIRPVEIPLYFTCGTLTEIYTWCATRISNA